MVLFIRSDIALSAPISGTPTLPPAPHTSDGFNRANALHLGTSDAALGGTRLPWVGHPETFAIASNRAVLQETKPSSFFTGFNVPHRDIEVSLTVRAKPEGDAVWLDIRRPLAAVSPTQDAIRLAFNSTSLAVQLLSRVSVIGYSHGSAIGYQLGDRVGLRVTGTTAQVLVNGAVMHTEVLSDPQLQVGRHVGFAGLGSSQAFAFDDFTVSPV